MISTELVALDHACATVPPQFDYAGLGPDTVDEARAAADRIRKLGHQQNEAIFAIGRELIAIMAKLSHGQWVSWLRAEFGMSVSTAERYIRVAEKLPEKIVTVTNLRPTTLYALSAKSTPGPVREEIVARVESGKALSDKEIRRLVAQGEAARKTAEGGEEQVEAQRPKDATSDEPQIGPETRRCPHQEAMVKMLLRAFNDDQLRELADHLVHSGWADPSAEHGLIHAIKRRAIEDDDEPASPDNAAATLPVSALLQPRSAIGVSAAAAQAAFSPTKPERSGPVENDADPVSPAASFGNNRLRCEAKYGTCRYGDCMRRGRCLAAIVPLTADARAA